MTEPLILTPGQLDAIEDNLAAGLPYLKACGKVNTLAVVRASKALEASDPVWAARVRAAEAKGAAALAERKRAQDEVMRPRLPAAGEEASECVAIAQPIAEAGSVGSCALLGGTSGAGTNFSDEARGAAPAAVEPSVSGRPAPTYSKAASEATDDGAPDWDRFRAEAEAEYGDGIFGLFLWQSERLRIRGFAPCSPWWRWSIGEFYRSRKRWGAWQVGRGGGKSKMMTEVAALESLWQEHEIPPGETWLFPFVSVIKPDARKRLAGIQSILLQCYNLFVDIGYPDNVATIDTLKIDGKAHKFTNASGGTIAFVSMASTIAALSGPNTLGIVLDELTKMRDAVTGANPSTEIVRTARQTFRSRDNIHGFLCSSALTKSGFHYDTIIAGQTDLTFVATIGAEFIGYVREVYERLARAETDPEAAAAIREAASGLKADSPHVPTWLANPSQSPEATRAEEPDVTVWLREVGAFPQGGEGGTWDTLADVAIARATPAAPVDTVVGVAPSVDGSEWGIVVVGYAADGTIAVLRDASGPLNGQDATARIRSVAVGASVLCVATEHERRAAGELAATFTGREHTPPVATCAVYDDGRLRVGPLRSLYASGRLRHTSGLHALERIARAWLPSSWRSPRLEALAAACKRLVDVYPFGGTAWTPGKTPPRERGMNEERIEEE